MTHMSIFAEFLQDRFEVPVINHSVWHVVFKFPKPVTSWIDDITRDAKMPAVRSTLLEGSTSVWTEADLPRT